jgi:hypothetical protein
MMARKRRIEPATVERPEPVRKKGRKAPSWQQWALKTYARYWYVLGCISLDFLLFAEVQRAGWGGTAIALVALASALALEAAVYLVLWPLRRDGPEEGEDGQEFL